MISSTLPALSLLFPVPCFIFFTACILLWNCLICLFVYLFIFFLLPEAPEDGKRSSFFSPGLISRANKWMCAQSWLSAVAGLSEAGPGWPGPLPWESIWAEVEARLVSRRLTETEELRKLPSVNLSLLDETLTRKQDPRLAWGESAIVLHVWISPIFNSCLVALNS